MSEMVYGPPFVVDGPVPEAPPFRLLDTARLVPMGDEVHWENGVQVWPYSSDLPDATRPCLEGTFGLKNEGSGVDLPIFGPFTPYIADACSSISVHDQETYRRRAELVLAATESVPLEQQLIDGRWVPNNPYVGDANVDTLLSGVAQHPKEALALLEDAIGATGKQGLIHASPSIVSAWDGTGYSLVKEAGKLYTRRGTPVAVGDGYIGTKPDGAPALGAHEAYAYATGPVDIRRSDIFLLPDRIEQALDRGTNFIVYRAERTYVVDWDVTLQTAVLVNRSA